MTSRLQVAVLARAAVPGLAKTRLIGILGRQRAAALQAHLTQLAMRRAVDSGADVVLWIDGDPDGATRSAADELGIEVRAQPAGDLGRRMLAAFESSPGHATLVIGTDCPAQSVEHLVHAGKLLANHDVVLQPAHDGGYVLIGMKQPHHQLFRDIIWGSDSVLARTRQRASALGLSCAELPALHDLDRPADLKLALANGWIDARWT